MLDAITVNVEAGQEVWKIRSTDAEIEYIERYANEIGNVSIESSIEYTVDGSYKLYSFWDNGGYILYKLLPSGYAIYDEYSGKVEEMMPEAEIPYDFSIEEDYYYGGPMNYIVKRDNYYYDLTSGYELTEEDITYISTIEKQVIEKRESVCAIPTYSRDYYMKSATYFGDTMLGDNFGDNKNGTCTHIACAIMLGFYADNGYDSYVPSKYRGKSYGTNEDFHQYLQTFLGKSSCSIENAASCLKSYFKAISVSGVTVNYDIGNHEKVFSRVTSNISNNKPTVAAMFHSYNNNCPDDHTVVAYGCHQEFSGSIMTSASYYVHTGWHSTHLGVYAYEWFADDLYLS